MRRLSYLAIAVLVVLVGLPLGALSPGPVFAQTGCGGLSSPITSVLTISGSTCSWTGPLIISGDGSLILQSSQLFISNEVSYNSTLFRGVNVTAVNTIPGYVGLNSSGSIQLEGNSTVRTFGLDLSGISTASVSGGSNLNVTANTYVQFNPRTGNVTTTVPGNLTLLDSSKLSLDGGSKLTSTYTELGAVSAVSVSGGSSLTLGEVVTEPFYAGSFSMDSSYLTAAGNSIFSIGGSAVSISKSTLSVTGFFSAALGGTSTTISQSSLSFTNNAKVQVGSKNSTQSTTSISGSTLSISGLTSDASMPRTGGIQTSIYGQQTLSVTGSNISSILSTSASSYSYQIQNVKYTDYPNSTLSLVGGTVGIQSSMITSSAREFFGFQPNSYSQLLVNASSSLVVSNSQVVSGQSNVLGTFANSALTLLAHGDNNVTQTLVQSEAISQSLIVQSLSTATTSTLNLVQDRIETGTSSGMVGVRSSYIANLDRTFVDANATSANFKASAFKLNVIDSTLNIQNLSRSTVFGPNVAMGRFVNTTLSNCAALACFKTQGTGSYAVFDYLNVRVVGANSQAAAGATVTATSYRVPFTTYTSVADQNGWARFLALVQSENGTGVLNVMSYYIIQGSVGGLASPQAQLFTTGNFTAQVQVLLPPTNFPSSAVVGKSVSTIASEYNLVSYPRLISPAGQYALGNYIGAQYIPYFYVLSNAVPVGFRNNATNNEIDFNTLGTTGGEFNFVLIYPTNLTTVNLGLNVDGNTSLPVTRLSNSTTSFVLFSIPSGAHSVALTYLPPNGNYAGGVQYPRFFPPASTIVAVIVVLVAGLIFAILFVRSREKRMSAGAPTARSPVVS